MSDRPTNHEQRVDLTPSLVAHLRDGHTTAGAMLDELYRQKLIHFCHGYLGSRDDAEDVVQEVFFRVLKNSAVPDNFRAWIYKICRNRCLDVQRARSRKRDNRVLPDASFLDARLTGNLTRLVRREQRSRLRHLLAALPANQREILRLRYAEGLSRAEIADVLEIPEPLVKSRLYESLKTLRQHTSLVDGS